MPALARTRRQPRAPQPRTALIGRGRELACLWAPLEREEARLVNLTGPAGAGKTPLLRMKNFDAGVVSSSSASGRVSATSGCSPMTKTLSPFSANSGCDFAAEADAAGLLALKTAPGK